MESLNTMNFYKNSLYLKIFSFNILHESKTFIAYVSSPQIGENMNISGVTCGCVCVWVSSQTLNQMILSAQLGMNHLPLEDSPASYSFFFQPQTFSNMADTRVFKMEGT